MVVSSIPYTILVENSFSRPHNSKEMQYVDNRVQQTEDCTLEQYRVSQQKQSSQRPTNMKKRHAGFAHTNRQPMSSSSNGTSSSPYKSKVEGEVLGSIPTKNAW